jgi:hypothetical protein
MADPALRVFVVWVPFLGGSRDAINPAVFPDGRVTSLWDQNAVSSQWFSQHVTKQPGPTWDYRALSSPGAVEHRSPAVVSQGGTVISQSGQLLAPFARCCVEPGRPVTPGSCSFAVAAAGWRGVSATVLAGCRRGMRYLPAA